LLRWLRPDSASALAALPAPEISFNYLGQLDQALPAGSLFAPAAEPSGAPVDPAGRRSHRLAIAGEISGGRLRLDWSFGSAVLDRATVEGWAERYLAELRRLIAHCREMAAAGRSGCTPSDFPLAGIDALELDALAASATGGIADLYPLSPLQEGILFHALYAPSSGVYVEQVLCTLAGDVDAEALEGAWRRVVARHPILRTSIAWEGLSRPLQVVHAEVPVRVEREDWSGLPAADRERRLPALLAADRERGFDLARAPLLRWRLVRTGPAEHRFLWSHHHVLLDGWSYAAVISEFLAAYAALRSGEEPRLPWRPAYRDYIAWLGRQDPLAAERHWRRALAGFAEPTPLPLESARAGESSRGGRAADRAARTARLGRAATAALEAQARRAGVTANTLVQGAWAILLSRLTGRSEVVFGATVSGRPADLPGVESMVGLFINTLPVRAAVAVSAEAPRLAAWLRELQARQLEAREFEHSPLARIQGWSEVPRGTPLFETLVVFENYPRDAAMGQGGALGVTAVDTVEQTNYPLGLAALPGDDLALHLDLDRTRIEPTAAARLLGYLASLLGGMAAGALDADLPLAALSLLAEAERHQLIVEWNDSRRAAPAAPSALALIEAQAALRPAALAVASGARRLTYGELDRAADGLAARLAALGAGEGSVAAILAGRSAEAVVAALAAWKAGAAYLPLDPAWPPDRLAYVLADSGALALLVHPALRPLLPAGIAERGMAVLDLARDLEEVAVRPPAGPSPAGAVRMERGTAAGDLPAYVIYTSGSTGRPKGVAVSHRSLLNLLAHHGAVYRLEPDDRATQIAGPAFDAAVWEIWPALASGASLHVPDDETRAAPAALVAWLAAEGITVCYLPTPLTELVLDLPWPEETRLRLLTTGGDKLHRAPPPGLPFRLFDHYGPTEATVVATSAEVPPGPGKPSIGRPVANLRVHLVDRAGEAVPIGVAGELWVGGAGVALGYPRRPELTAERFVPDSWPDPWPDPWSDGGRGARLYRTGDLARWRADGEVEFLGRIDDQVKVRGFRVELGEIEAALAAHPGVRLAAAIVAPAAGGAESRLAAYYVPAGEGASSADLRQHLLAELPPYMVPALFAAVEELPLTANGKVDRRALAARAAALESAGGTGRDGRGSRPHRPPRTPAEDLLCRVWGEVLRLEGVGIDDDFFALGGDSILSIQVVARAARAGCRITPRQLFEHPTVAELAAVAGTVAAAEAEQGEVTGPVPLTPIQRWFFAGDPTDRHHFNQAVLLRLTRPLPARTAERAWTALVAHHDALRLRFGWTEASAGVATEVAPEISQEIAPVAAEPPSWSRIDLSGLGAVASAGLASAGSAVQASLDLARGPLARAAWLDLPGGEARLLLVVHHLAIDGVSWRVLLDDLETACRQLAAGESASSPALPPKTTSFQRWAEELAAHARSLPATGVDAAVVWWTEAAALPRATLPSAEPLTGGMVAVALDAETTRALLQDVPAAYRTRIDDALLTALVQALAAEGEALWVDLEGHGREELFPGVDLTRTVGWFTSLYPVALALPPMSTADPGAALRAVKEQLRAVPQRGMSFGLLRHLRGDARLASLAAPQVAFNYLGQLDPVLGGGSLFAPAPEPAGEPESPRRRRDHRLTVNAFVQEGELQVGFGYAGGAEGPLRPWAERLAVAYLERLRALVAHCAAAVAAGKTGATPSDFPLAASALDQPALDGVLAACAGAKVQAEVEDLYPLSPLQEGLLFHSLYAPGSGVYVEQLMVTLAGDLDVPAVEGALSRIVLRTPVLRTSFHWRGLARPLQAVHRSAQVALTTADWSAQWPALGDAERRERLAELVQRERLLEFDLGRPPLMRWHLVKTGEDSHRLLWSHHHLLLDGWSYAALIGDFVAAYEALVAGAEPHLPVRPPFRDYIAWLAAREGRDEGYWRAALAGWSEPTPIPADRRQSGDSERRRTVDAGLDPAATAALEAAARRAGLTPSTLVQAAWGLVLAHYGAVDDVVFGTTVSGRPGELPGVGRSSGCSSTPCRSASRSVTRRRSPPGWRTSSAGSSSSASTSRRRSSRSRSGARCRAACRSSTASSPTRTIPATPRCAARVPASASSMSRASSRPITRSPCSPCRTAGCCCASPTIRAASTARPWRVSPPTPATSPRRSPARSTRTTAPASAIWRSSLRPSATSSSASGTIPGGRRRARTAARRPACTTSSSPPRAGRRTPWPSCSRGRASPTAGSSAAAVPGRGGWPRRGPAAARSWGSAASARPRWWRWSSPCSAPAPPTWRSIPSTRRRASPRCSPTPAAAWRSPAPASPTVWRLSTARCSPPPVCSQGETPRPISTSAASSAAAPGRGRSMPPIACTPRVRRAGPRGSSPIMAARCLICAG
jgi:amino acid adenylation domain-containing protein/non-ribosomal peptide synthase protein (TIGR01720 family)